MLWSLAWRNLWRQRNRTFLSLASMIFASALLVFILSFQLGSYETMKVNMLGIMDGFAQVQPAGYKDDPDVATFITGAPELAAELAKMPGISAATARATSFVILANGDTSYGAAVAGIDPVNEAKVSTLGNTLAEGRYLQPGDNDAIVLGDVLARNLGLQVGDYVTLLGSGADRSVAADSIKLVGTFHSGMSQLDRQIAQIPLARFQETFAMPGGANAVVLTGTSLADVNRALPGLRERVAPDGLAVLDWAELQPALKEAILLDATTSISMYVSLVVVVVFIILNTLLMSVLERTREFGVLMALGMKPGQLGRMMWLELVLLAALGCGIGIAVGGAVTVYFEIVGIAFPSMEGMLAEFGLPSRIFPDLSVISALGGPMMIVVSVAIGGIIPYLRILRLEPVAAMGSG